MPLLYANRQRSQTEEPSRSEEAEIENDFQKKCRRGAKFAAHTAFSAILGEISCLFSLALEFFTRFRGGLFLAGGPSGPQRSCPTNVDAESSECAVSAVVRTCPSSAAPWDSTCTDLNSVCYNSGTEHGQMFCFAVPVGGFGAVWLTVHLLSI